MHTPIGEKTSKTPSQGGIPVKNVTFFGRAICWILHPLFQTMQFEKPWKALFFQWFLMPWKSCRRDFWIYWHTSRKLKNTRVFWGLVLRDVCIFVILHIGVCIENWTLKKGVVRVFAQLGAPISASGALVGGNARQPSWKHGENKPPKHGGGTRLAPKARRCSCDQS